MSSLLIKNGRVIDPSRFLDEIQDIWIVDGRFAAVGKRPPSPDQTFDATGMIVMPGFVDVHVHLREPGDEASETIESGSAAALAGGFTSIICMPNTTPALDSPERLRRVLEKAAGLCGPRVYAMGAITIGREGKTLADMEALAAAGAVAFTDDGNGLQDDDLARRAFERCAELGKRLAEHCEVASISAGGVMRSGPAAERAGLPGISVEAETAMVERDLALARETDALLHIQHVSSALSVAMIAEARAEGVRVSAEVTPHHLTLTDEDAARGGPDFKMKPPLGTAADRRELVKALEEGTLDIVATDHAPHAPEKKSKGMLAAPFGVIGMETAAAVIWTRLVLEGWISPAQMVERMSMAPAAAFGLTAGTLQPGRPGDVVIFDPTASWKVQPKAFRSRSRNCPFAGWTLQGRVRATIVGGEVRYRDDLR